MKLLMETWRNFLTEGMKTPDDLPEGFGIEVSKQQGGSFYFVYTKDGNPQWTVQGGVPSGYVAVVLAEDMNYGDCLNGYYVQASEAAKGWGPMLYDLAMEWATHKGGGLMADRGSVSKDAHAVWKYYDENRPDIESAQLDIVQHRMLKQLTPDDPSDDCGQHTSIVWTDYNKGEWYDAPTSRVFRAKGNPTMEKLLGMGKLKIGKGVS